MLLTAAMVALTLGAGNPCDAPGARCPDLVMRAPAQLTMLPGHRLASTNQIVNVGTGPAEVHGHVTSHHVMSARQILRPGAGGKPQRLPDTGLRLVFHDTITNGTYWKLRHAARFSLRPERPDGSLGPVRRYGPKLDYCLRDLFRLKRPGSAKHYAGSPEYRKYGACSQNPAQRSRTLGTSIGWTDSYPYTYPQNWIDVRGLRGCYAYIQTADPNDQILESNEFNNSRAAVVRLPWHGPGLRGCPLLKDRQTYGSGAEGSPPVRDTGEY